ncbi:hypothetical protein BRAS3809_750004 [Bradyrhizobium sp. STM 3809]|nr:hypothetical protein BRAS3809_750004 [Bradyrhizobium sp. STM 3809]
MPLIRPDARRAQTTGMVADVKSQRPDTPKLVSPAQCASIVTAWWPTSPAHQGDCV